LDEYGLPVIAEHWKEDVRNLYREALRGPITILPTREPPSLRTGWYNDRGIAFCNRSETREAIETAFRETATTIDERRIVVNEDLTVNEKSLVEIKRPGTFVAQHVAGIHALEIVPLRIDPTMRDLVEAFGTDAKKRRKTGQKLLRDHHTVRDILDHADALSGAKFYLEYVTDYRGRLHPATPLNFGGDDRSRCLFRFANGKHLGGRLAGAAGGFTDLEVLELNIANRYGVVDKKPWLDRLAWVRANISMIREVAAKPFNTFILWSKADEPFQFVSACREWAAAENDADFVTTLPICWDASANGLQHLSLLARDDDGAIYTNLVDNPRGEPQDIYMRVAKAVVEKLRESSEVEANWWCQRTDDWPETHFRKLFKKVVMTLPYNANTSIPMALAEALLSVDKGERPPGGYLGYLHRKTIEVVSRFNAACHGASGGGHHTCNPLQ
jgi:hypothetical protein